MRKNLVKLWKIEKTFQYCYYDLNNNLYYGCSDSLYKLDPYTGEGELTNLPIITKVKGKNINTAKEGKKYSFKIEDKEHSVPVGHTEKIFYYTKRKGARDVLKVYDIENGEKVYELKIRKGYEVFAESSLISRYILIYTYGLDFKNMTVKSWSLMLRKTKYVG
ncbi:MAG: hypothetical protein B6U95_02390 [Thermofilum sp. ex4484_82]|nr:MAG: hypothetical protein B6U95_02390 [Thermofilum sp. ex4484_82]OYT39304.1 MAG: hypothetical protein B6U96_02385 [Archaeoglobales archaeon ex4484_92]